MALEGETRREFLRRTIGAAGTAVGINNAEAGRVTRDAASGIRNEARFADPRFVANTLVEGWVDGFMLKDKLFLDQIRSVARTGRAAEVLYDMRKKSDGNLLHKGGDAGLGPWLVLYENCYALLRSVSATSIGVEVGMRTSTGARTKVLEFSMPAPAAK
ncbi:MAG: hypothetical protein AB7G08_26205 [Hyphomicrobiaceae bacterium]|jgi:hypothetical protein